MPKRHLSLQNKGSDYEQQPKQSSGIITRLSSKRINIDESIPVKKIKIQEEYVDKENIPKRSTRQSVKTKIIEPIPPPPLPPAPVIIVEPAPEPEKIISNVPEYSDDEEEEEVEEEYPIAATDDKGEDHPTNKQYITYEKSASNQQAYIISKTARYWSLKYRKVLRHISPDSYGMYIHNDFMNYGELEVVENCILDLTKAIFVAQQGVLSRFNYTRKPADKINYILAFRRLEALTILLEDTEEISGIDDADRYYDIIRVIGACYVTILQGLLPKLMFKKLEKKTDEELIKKLNKISKQIPNFKQVLEQAILIGHMFLTIADVCSAYTKILQIVYCNWVLLMEKISIDLNGTSTDKLLKALKHASEIQEVEYGSKETFDFMNELRLYKQDCPSMGGDSHDLSKWSRAEREVYSFDLYTNDLF